jgi:hypothetical protein
MSDSQLASLIAYIFVTNSLLFIMFISLLELYKFLLDRLKDQKKIDLTIKDSIEEIYRMLNRRE